MKVKKYWVVTASTDIRKIQRVYCAKSVKKAIDKFYQDSINLYQNLECIVESVKPLEINLGVKNNENM